MHPWHHNNVGGVTADQARRKSSNVGGGGSLQARWDITLVVVMICVSLDRFGALWNNVLTVNHRWFVAGIGLGWLCIYHQPYTAACVCTSTDGKILT